VPGIRGKVVLTTDGHIDLGPYGTMSLSGMTCSRPATPSPSTWLTT